MVNTSKSLLDLLMLRKLGQTHPIDLATMKARFNIELTKEENDRLTAYLSSCYQNGDNSWYEFIDQLAEVDGSVLQHLTDDDSLNEFIVQTVLNLETPVDKYWSQNDFQTGVVIDTLIQNIYDVTYSCDEGWEESFFQTLEKLIKIDLNKTFDILCIEKETDVNTRMIKLIINFIQRWQSWNLSAHYSGYINKENGYTIFTIQINDSEKLLVNIDKLLTGFSYVEYCVRERIYD